MKADLKSLHCIYIDANHHYIYMYAFIIQTLLSKATYKRWINNQVTQKNSWKETHS